MTLPRLDAIKARWKICPPIDVTLAVAVQAYKPKSYESQAPSSMMGEIQASLGGASFTMGKTPAWALPKKAKST